MGCKHEYRGSCCAPGVVASTGGAACTGVRMGVPA